MIYLSKTAGYAIHALSCMELEGHSLRFIRDIAACTGLKKPYLAKIINQLVHDGLVVAKRGYRGGISLADPPEKVTLLRIVKATEGDGWFHPCLFGLAACPANHACPAHESWRRVGQKLEALLQSTTLADVVKATQAQLACRQPWPKKPIRPRGRTAARSAAIGSGAPAK